MDPAALAAGPATFQLDLTPSAGSSGLAGALAGARATLARRLLRWNPDLGGVLLGIRDERLVGGVVRFIVEGEGGAEARRRGPRGEGGGTRIGARFSTPLSFIVSSFVPPSSLPGPHRRGLPARPRPGGRPRHCLPPPAGDGPE